MEEIVTPGISFMMGSGDRFSPTTIAMDATKICQLFNDFSKDVLAKFNDIYNKLTNINTRVSNFVEDR